MGLFRRSPIKLARRLDKAREMRNKSKTDDETEDDTCAGEN
tara:strand:- start:513 stop:635 length:123 start_codon:yes stop_codon:yes gene_type:complete